MTTIAYRDGIIVSDSLVTNINDIRCGSVKKIAKGEGILGGAAGPLGSSFKFLEWVRHNCVDAMPEFKGDINCILIKDGVIHYISRDSVIVPIDCEFIAIGSGEEIALGAMANGATSREAVEIAIRLDCTSGGEIRTLKL